MDRKAMIINELYKIEKIVWDCSNYIRVCIDLKNIYTTLVVSLDSNSNWIVRNNVKTIMEIHGFRGETIKNIIADFILSYFEDEEFRATNFRIYND